MLIDRFLPTFDVTQVCETRVDAPPDETYRAILEADLRDPLVNALFSIRELPLRIARRLRGAPPSPAPPKLKFGTMTNQTTKGRGGWCSPRSPARRRSGHAARVAEHQDGSRGSAGEPAAPAPALLRVLDPVRATRFERTRPLAGDHLIPEPIASLTHAITVECDRQTLWPWLAQMGAGRAGWYSYDFIDNGRQPSAEEVRPELQNIGVDTLLPGLPGVTDGFVVVECEPERSLVLGWPSPDGVYGSTWAFVLAEAGPDRTRLIARARGGRGYEFHGLPLWLAKRIVPVGHYVMQRKQLREIARRAAHSPRYAPLEACS